MTISYNWLCEYLPGKEEGLLEKPTPDQLSKILTSIGLEVENVSKFESVKGNLSGLVVGEVVSCEKHPNADKLKLTQVNIGGPELLQIVCGASNVAAGQKVIVAPVSTTIYPIKGDPFEIKLAKIRGVESQGMICAEDEIGLGEDHNGIIVLNKDAEIGKPASAYFNLYDDHIIEIGLTPNHMDAMSHLGVARDVCAYLSHHQQKKYKVKTPSTSEFKVDDYSLPIDVSIENETDCERYSGVSIKGISIGPSPQWMQQKLKAIGVRPINNIVDITNFVLHETGQPLHAYDAAAVKGNRIIVKNLPAGTKFITLDEKERTLSAEDLMICNLEEGMCIAGVFGGLRSGVTDTTKEIFLEAAWFNPLSIRKTSLRHGLRTDAASHFEKGMDISQTVPVLKRAANLIKSIAGGKIASSIVDVYPKPKQKTQVSLQFDYLKKLSGKKYSNENVKEILENLDFAILQENTNQLLVASPYHKTDISLPADIVEEIMRIDGLDNIEIPSTISISPSIETDKEKFLYQEKIAGYLIGCGFHEIFTNSITNSAYYSEKELQNTVKMINNLSAELNIMRPSLLETGLESISYNINRKNSNLLFFEFGKTYSTSGIGKYAEENHLCLYVTGNLNDDSWKMKAQGADFFYLKGLCNQILRSLGINASFVTEKDDQKLKNIVQVIVEKELVLRTGSVDSSLLRNFDIKQPVFFADFKWDVLMKLASAQRIEFKELAKQLPVYRDLAMVVNRSLAYEDVEKTTQQIGLDKLQKVQLFDIFESEKLGKDKKSLAISFTFIDEEKTLTDKEIDAMMNKIMTTFEEKLSAEIRK